jgi:hypothetical protein
MTIIKCYIFSMAETAVLPLSSFQSFSLYNEVYALFFMKLKLELSMSIKNAILARIVHAVVIYIYIYIYQ